MKEENVREWGIIHPLGSLAFTTDCQTTSSPTPENLIYHFTSTFAFSKGRGSSTATLIPIAKSYEPAEVVPESPSQALALNYSHPRFIEYPEEEIVINRRTRPVIPLLLAAVFVFVVWYIYHLTGLQLQLQSENNHYLATLAQEKQAAAELGSPHIRVLEFQEIERSEVTAKLFWDTTKQSCQVYLNHLPEASPNEAFQLWYFTKDSKFIPVTTFKAIEGSAAVKIKLPGEKLAQIDRIIVSLEPPGNYPFPVGQILLRGHLR